MFTEPKITRRIFESGKTLFANFSQASKTQISEEKIIEIYFEKFHETEKLKGSQTTFFLVKVSKNASIPLVKWKILPKVAECRKT